MEKFWFILGLMLVIILIFGAVFFGLTPTGREIWTQFTNKDKGDIITDEQRKNVETMARDLIADWAKEAEAYKDGDTEAKERANQAADAYNKFITTNGYVFGETLPEGIYAAIEAIE